MSPWADVINDIHGELERSVALHPHYPDDNLRRAALTCEEAGEVIRAAIDVTRLPDRWIKEDALLKCLYDECRHTAAMAIKHMLALKGVDVDAYLKTPDPAVNMGVDWGSRREER